MVAKNNTVAVVHADEMSDEALIALAEKGDFTSLGPITDYGDVAPGMNIVKADELVGIPFTILRWKEHLGDYGPFASLTVAWETNPGTLKAEKHVAILNNGSLKSGIFEQVQSMWEKGIKAPLFVSGGLRKSEYTNEFGPAKTFYLSN